MLLGLGGNLTTAYFISDVICAEPAHPIRAKLFCTSLFMTGLCTTLMSLVGVRYLRTFFVLTSHLVISSRFYKRKSTYNVT